MPRTRRARVAGIYHLGLYEFDSLVRASSSLDVRRAADGMSMAGLDPASRDGHLRRAAHRRRHPEASRADVRRAGLDRSEPVALLRARLEKMAISITIGLIVMVAALNIVASLILLVMEKSRDIAILKTMGTSPSGVMTIFMLQGLIIGYRERLVGGIGGLALVLACSISYRLIQDPADVYQVAYVPFVVLPRDFIDRDRLRDRDLLSRDDLSVAPGVAARSGAGAAVRVASNPSSIQATNSDLYFRRPRRRYSPSSAIAASWDSAVGMDVVHRCHLSPSSL